MPIPCTHIMFKNAVACANQRAEVMRLRQRVYKRYNWWVVETSDRQNMRGLQRLSR